MATRSQKWAATPISRVMYSIADCFLAYQRPQQLEHLRLDGDVEPAGGVVGDHELRRADQRDGDDHALRHAATQLVRIGAIAPLGIGDADRLEDVERGLLGRGSGEPEMDLRDLRDLMADAFQRIELTARVGHHHGEITAAQHAQLVARQPGEVADLRSGPVLRRSRRVRAPCP